MEKWKFVSRLESWFVCYPTTLGERSQSSFRIDAAWNLALIVSELCVEGNSNSCSSRDGGEKDLVVGDCNK